MLACGSETRTSFYLIESVMGHILEDDWLHRENISELHLGDVQSTDDMGPAWEKGKNK